MPGPGRASLRRLLRWSWRWSWLLTLPLTALFLTWAAATASRFADFGLRYQLFFEPPSLLQRIGRMELDHYLRGLRLAAGRTPDLSAQGIDQLYLFVGEQQKKHLDRNLPHSGRSYVEAWLRYPDGDIREVKIRYRGDFYYHWAFYKKSLRVRTKKRSLFDGMRSFNLIAPKFPPQINNYLSYELAGMMGLMTPRHEMVNLWLNGKNQGLFLFLEQLEESTLRNSGRMPGDLYSGELVARDSYRGVANNLFLHPRLWEKIAVNNHYSEDSFAPLEALIEALHAEQGGDCRRLSGLLDVEVWGRFLAYEILTQSFHYSNTHNWRLYYDPARSMFEPVVWDPDGWHPVWMPKERQRARTDIRSGDLHDRLLANHELLLARHRAIEEFFATHRDQVFLDKIDRIIESASLAVEHDPNLVFQFESLRPREVMAAMRELRTDVERVFLDVREAYLGGAGNLRYRFDRQTAAIELTVGNRRPLSGLRLEYARPVREPGGTTLAYLIDGRSEEVDVSGVTSFRGSSVLVDLHLLPSFVPIRTGARGARSRNLAVEPAYYRLSLEGLTPENRLLGLDARYGDGTSLPARRVREMQPLELRGTQVVTCPKPIEAAGIWRGERTVDGVLTVGDLIIRPGTTVRMRAGASLIVAGRLVAEGTKNRPIRFVPAVEGQEPWGAVVVKGPAASGSSLRHCELARGSGYKSELFEFSAMLSIHDVPNVTIANCHFRDSQIVDDMLHVVYGGVEIRDSVFENALFDAIDLDIVEGSIHGSVFKNSGNDALDLMTSDVTVTGSHLQGSGDKGISIGEGANLVAIDNLLENNQIGMEAKDGSRVYVYNTTFRGNGKALNAYQKNWRYGQGGEIRLYFSSLDGTGEAATADKRSQILLSASTVPAAIQPSKRLIIEPVDQDRTRRSARGLELPGFARKYSRLIKPRQTGSKTYAD